MNMPMNIGYLILEAERVKSPAEQRAADARTGELAAGVARLGRSVKETVRRAAGMKPAGGRAVSVADLERLYSAPCAPAPLDSHGADGERTVRSR
jgi:hypothetical protein